MENKISVIIDIPQSIYNLIEENCNKKSISLSEYFIELAKNHKEIIDFASIIKNQDGLDIHEDEIRPTFSDSSSKININKNRGNKNRGDKT
jgi:hypothetical protein